MKRWIYLAVLLMAFAPSSYAGIFSSVDKVELDDTVGGIMMAKIDIRTEWDATDQQVNPCLNYYRCGIMIDLINGNTGAYITSVVDYSYSNTNVGVNACISQSVRIGELGKCLEGLTPSWWTSNNSNFPGKIAWPLTIQFTLPFAWVEKQNICLNIRWGSTLDGKGGTLPGMVCGLAPPPIGSCLFPDTAEFDHGILSNESLDGKTISQKMNVTCNYDVKGALSLSMLTNNKIKLSDSLFSEIKVDGTTLTETPQPVNIVVGTNTFTLTSTLATAGKVTAGDYTGQSILLFSLY